MEIDSCLQDRLTESINECIFLSPESPNLLIFEK